MQQVASQDDGWRTWVPVLSAMVAICVFVLGLSNRHLAKQALRISEQQEARRHAVVDLHLIEAVAWTPSDTDRYVAAHVRVVNQSDRDGSLYAVDLHVATEGPSGELTTVMVGHAPPDVLPDRVEVLAVPLRLATNGAESGWFTFPVGPGITGGRPVNGYAVVARDTRGGAARIEFTLVRELPGGP